MNRHVVAKPEVRHLICHVDRSLPVSISFGKGTIHFSKSFYLSSASDSLSRSVWETFFHHRTRCLHSVYILFTFFSSLSSRIHRTSSVFKILITSRYVDNDINTSYIMKKKKKHYDILLLLLLVVCVI